MITFIFVVLMLFLIPGPAVLITISQTMRGGQKSGILTGVGIAVGDLLHTTAAVLGLSAILMTSALAFEAVKYAGAAYLIYLGVRALVQKKAKQTPAVPQLSTGSSFRQGLLIELLNPKTSLFFLAFLPQFVQRDGGSVTMQLLVLGLTFVLMSILYTTALVLLSGAIGKRLMQQTRQTSGWLGKAVGLVYISLGIKLALQTR
ncbi:LysE family translocator [Ectobacillus ponti]|uniref:LysE family translocator n=1 Tax=Ectobacillus ponti TaxID=2961894 RepID=A0AA41XC55_9BACI|nr:LysE family translocator [Ectobacillus ponti]MCP8969331.1 LysE family translocator [Ectobacillus ponti]